MARTRNTRLPHPSHARVKSGRWLRLPSRTVRLRLTLLYSGLFLVSGLALLATMYLLFRRDTGVDLIVGGGTNGASRDPDVARQIRQAFDAAVARHSQGLHVGLIQSGVAFAVMAIVSVLLGWLVAGRVLRPLRVMTDTTRQISERNLDERLALPGPSDELKDLADTIDGLLDRLQAHLAEQQRFAANASHELRTPLAITQTLLDVARSDPNCDRSELDERLRAVNARAIDLTEALLTLSRADQHSFTPAPVDLSLIVEEATETLLPLAEKHGITIETTGEPSPTMGSEALLLQLTTNLVHNAIAHNLPDGGQVWVAAEALSKHVMLTVESTGEALTTQLVDTLVEPFQRGTERVHTDHAGVGLGLAIVKSITQAHGGVLTLTPRLDGGLCVTVELPLGPGLTDPPAAAARSRTEAGPVSATTEQN